MTKSLPDKVYEAKVKENVTRVLSEIRDTAAKYSADADSIFVLAATKTVRPSVIDIALATGVRLIGENRSDELLEKYPHYSVKKERIHFIGHLQTNKVKGIIDKVSMIQSVHSLKLMGVINDLCRKTDEVMDILIEVNIATEASKSGTDPDRLEEFLIRAREFPFVRIKGLMTIPPIGGGEYFFPKMRELFLSLREKAMSHVSMDILSMGMSADFKAAIRYGSNMLRIGTAFFGSRG